LSGDSQDGQVIDAGGIGSERSDRVLGVLAAPRVIEDLIGFTSDGEVVSRDTGGTRRADRRLAPGQSRGGCRDGRENKHYGYAHKKLGPPVGLNMHRCHIPQNCCEEIA
jgi:hypothetical protein